MDGNNCVIKKPQSEYIYRFCDMGPIICSLLGSPEF